MRLQWSLASSVQQHLKRPALSVLTCLMLQRKTLWLPLLRVIMMSCTLQCMAVLVRMAVSRVFLRFCTFHTRFRAFLRLLWEQKKSCRSLCIGRQAFQLLRELMFLQALFLQMSKLISLSRTLVFQCLLSLLVTAPATVLRALLREKSFPLHLNLQVSRESVF